MFEAAKPLPAVAFLLLPFLWRSKEKEVPRAGMRRKGEQNKNNKNRLESNFACEQYALQFNFCK
ncbi:hypothetical protein A7P99_02595 [Eikenella sp. NML120348]|nr:hypothetical protein A7P99_02595 [Eikenella sp. NML120348]